MNLLDQLNRCHNSTMTCSVQGGRVCSICKTRKDESEYPIKNKAKGYLDTRCYECKRKYMKKYMRDYRAIPIDTSK